MSFAATLGLVALVQIGMPNLFAAPDHSATAPGGAVGRPRGHDARCLASLVAELTDLTPHAAFHFHRVTPYGLLANLAAMPVVSALVMPAGLLGLLAMPFGFDGVFWAILGAGIDWMIVVTQHVATLPGAVGRVGAFGIRPADRSKRRDRLARGCCARRCGRSGAALLVVAAVWAARVPAAGYPCSSDGHNVGFAAAMVGCI